MRIAIRDALSAGAALAGAQPLVHGESADDRVEIVLPGGVFEDATLQLGSVHDPRRLHVTVRGNGTILRRCRLHIYGASVIVEDVRIEESAEGEAVRLSASEAIRIERVAIVGLRAWPARPGTRVRSGVRLEALGPATRAVLNDMVLEDNTGPILQFSGQPRARFAEVAILASRFNRNESPEVRLGPVDVLRVEETVRAGDGAFAVVSSARTLVLSEPDRPVVT